MVYGFHKTTLFQSNVYCCEMGFKGFEISWIRTPPLTGEFSSNWYFSRIIHIERAGIINFLKKFKALLRLGTGSRPECSLLLVPEHWFGHHDWTRGLAPEEVLRHRATEARALIWTGFRKCLLYLLSHKLLKLQPQICRLFLDYSYYLSLVVYEHF